MPALPELDALGLRRSDLLGQTRSPSLTARGGSGSHGLRTTQDHLSATRPRVCAVDTAHHSSFRARCGSSSDRANGRPGGPRLTLPPNEPGNSGLSTPGGAPGAADCEFASGLASGILTVVVGVRVGIDIDGPGCRPRPARPPPPRPPKAPPPCTADPHLPETRRRAQWQRPKEEVEGG